MATVATSPGVMPPRLASDEVLKIARLDAERAYRDLTPYRIGIVLETGDPVDCSAENGFFAGGHGDFSVIPDRENKFFYFFFWFLSTPCLYPE